MKSLVAIIVNSIRAPNNSIKTCTFLPKRQASLKKPDELPQRQFSCARSRGAVYLREYRNVVSLSKDLPRLLPFSERRVFGMSFTHETVAIL